MLCFDLPNASWTLDDGKTVPGLNERAAILGYRSAAAASGTTSAARRRIAREVITEELHLRRTHPYCAPPQSFRRVSNEV